MTLIFIFLHAWDELTSLIVYYFIKKMMFYKLDRKDHLGTVSKNFFIYYSLPSQIPVLSCMCEGVNVKILLP